MAVEIKWSYGEVKVLEKDDSPDPVWSYGEVVLFYEYEAVGGEIMAITLDHTEANDISGTLTDPSPAKAVTGWASIDAGAGSYFDYVNIQITLTFAAGIDGDATIKRRISADSGTTDSDTNIDVFDVSYNAGGSKIVSFQLQKFNYVDIGIYNGTTTEAELTITSIKWEGLKVTDS